MAPSAAPPPTPSLPAAKESASGPRGCKEMLPRSATAKLSALAPPWLPATCEKPPIEDGMGSSANLAPIAAPTNAVPPPVASESCKVLAQRECPKRGGTANVAASLLGTSTASTASAPLPLAALAVALFASATPPYSEATPFATALSSIEFKTQTCGDHGVNGEVGAAVSNCPPSVLSLDTSIVVPLFPLLALITKPGPQPPPLVPPLPPPTSAAATGSMA
mmetsp:Transcript_69808/g.175864  ORF Transcript_69808/g.175864 Transcript_69808/m.175864 type:complete len:221 (+) Transcript_69808:542-1204(+)